VFASLTGEIYKWPARYAALKAELRPDPDPAVLAESWAALGAALDDEVAEIVRLQHEAVPICGLDEVVANGGALPAGVAAAVRKRGVVVIRGVIDEAVARGWKQEVQGYADANPGHTGFPKDNPQVLALYWSKPQLEARQHPRVRTAMLAAAGMYVGHCAHRPHTRDCACSPLDGLSRAFVSPFLSEFGGGPHGPGPLVAPAQVVCWEWL